MAPKLGLMHDSASSYHPSKPTEPVGISKTDEEAAALKATLPTVVALDANTCTVDEIVEQMKIAGGLIIRNAVAHDKLDLIESPC
jgi:hypothetical protein